MKIYPFFIPHGGCPHACLFCQQSRISGVWDLPSPAAVFAALERDLPERGEGEVAFFGGTFTLLPEENQRAYLRQVSSFIRGGRISGIRISTRPDAICKGKTALLKEYGVTTVELGCQSFAPEVLLTARRGHGPEAAAGAVATLREQGMQVGLQLMPGLPGGDRAEAIFSLQRALDLSPDFLRLYPTVVLKDTGLEAAWRNGSFAPLSLEEAVEWCADLLLLCRGAGVPVIRLGLQSTVELDQGESLVAGPYHPAFGQLVRSRLWRRAFALAFGMNGVAEVTVHPADLSDALGHRRENLHFLQQGFPLFSIRGQERVARDHFLSGDRLLSLNGLLAAGYSSGPERGVRI